MDSPNVELMSALASLFDCGKYSDLTIVCGMKRYSVHRAIVCSRSEFFENAIRNPFRESQTGVIDLTEDDPEAVEHMVNYFYHLDYLNKALSRRSSKRASRPASPRFSNRRPKKLNLALVEDPLVAMASAATCTNTPPTPPAEDVQRELESADKHPDTPMAGQDEEDPFDMLEGEATADVEKPHLITHAKVYAIAEKYGIAGLKSLARQKFSQQLELHLSSTELPEACQEAYETTVDSDRGLRDVIIQAFREHPELSLRNDMALALRETPGLSFELFRMASGLPITA